MCRIFQGGASVSSLFHNPVFFDLSWMTEHTPAKPCATLIQSNIFVAGYKHSYVIATKQI